MRDNWSEHDKKAKVAAEENFSWEKSNTEMSEEDISKLKETLEGRQTEYQSSAKRPIYRQETHDTNESESDSDSELIGCPDSNSFDPDI